MKVTGEIICRRTDAGEIACEWKGGRIAAITGALLDDAELNLQWANKDGLRLCQYHLRVVGFKVGVGTYSDTYFVMRDGLLARAASLADKVTRALRWKAKNLDVRLYRWAGRPLKPGSYIPKLSVSYVLMRLWYPQLWQTGKVSTT